MASAQLPLLDATAECDRPPMANCESVWLAMVGLDAWVYRLLIERGHLGTLALELASLVEQAQDRLNMGSIRGAMAVSEGSRVRRSRRGSTKRLLAGFGAAGPWQSRRPLTSAATRQRRRSPPGGCTSISAPTAPSGALRSRARGRPRQTGCRWSPEAPAACRAPSPRWLTRPTPSRPPRISCRDREFRAGWLPHLGTKCDLRRARDEPCEAS